MAAQASRRAMFGNVASSDEELTTRTAQYMSATAQMGRQVACRKSPQRIGVERTRIEYVTGTPKITARVLPVDAMIEGYSVPRSAFSIYTFSDPGDPTIVAVDTVTDDLLLSDDDDVKRYDELYERLRDASLSVPDSLDLLLDRAKAAV